MDNEIDYHYIFIGGTGRSGTNVTREIIASHSQVASFPFEYRFIIDPDGIIDFYNSFSTTWSPFMADIKIKRLYKFLLNLAVKKDDKENYTDWELAKWFPEYLKNVDVLISNVKSFEYHGLWPGAKGDSSNYNIWFSGHKSKERLSRILGGFIKNNINLFLDEKRRKYFVEDNTWNILFARELFELIPEAKFIHIIRDPRDVVASMIKQSWCPSELDKTINFYLSIIEKCIDNTNLIPADRVLLIKLEDIVKDYHNTIQKLFRFIGIEDEYLYVDNILSDESFGRWKREFSRKEISLLNKKLKRYLELLGYQI